MRTSFGNNGARTGHDVRRRGSFAMRKQACAALFALGFFGLIPAGISLAAQCDALPSPGLDWKGCSKRNLMLQGSNFQEADLSDADFALTDLSGTTLNAVNFEKTNLIRASLEGASAKRANFAKIEAYRSNFSGIDAEGASFIGAELQRGNLSGAKLAGADFEKADLSRVDFRKATISGVKFTLANLSRANLTATTFDAPLAFDRAFMFLTRIAGLDLSTATGLQQAQIEIACGDADTKLPPGLTTPANWPCTFD